jgi:hypothetical protein
MRNGLSPEFIDGYASSRVVAAVRDAKELKMFAWGNADLQPVSLVPRRGIAGVEPGLARSGQTDTF